MGNWAKKLPARLRQGRRLREVVVSDSVPARRVGNEIVVDVEAVARREVRFEETRQRAAAFEASSEIDDQEKSIAALIAVSRYAQDAGCPRETLDRIHNIIDAFWTVQSGSRVPLFEPANPVHGKGSRLVDIFKATCVAAVKTRRAMRDTDSDNDARRRFLADLWASLPSSDAAIKALFPFEGHPEPHSDAEARRQCGRLSDWSKARQMDDLDKMARHRYEQFITIAAEHGPEFADRAYAACLNQAINTAKALILHVG